jgi:hypothetical protein
VITRWTRRFLWTLLVGIQRKRTRGPVPKASGAAKDIYQMTNSDQTHPLGDEETDQINPAVAGELTTSQIEWLNSQSTAVGRKKLQILRQALFEWVGGHQDYRFSEARFGDTVGRALEEFMNRHRGEVLVSKTENGVGGPPQEQ